MKETEGTEGEHWMLHLRGDVAASFGRLRESREFTNRALVSAESRGLKDGAAVIAAEHALTEAEFGAADEARRLAEKSLVLSHNRRAWANLMIALARSQRATDAQALLTEHVSDPGLPRFLTLTMMPASRAAIALASGNATKAIDELKMSLEYDRSFILHPIYYRGVAYLARSDAESAAIEFERLLARQGQAVAWPLYPLAQLGLARAFAMDGRKEQGRKAYEEFFTMWKSADSDVPVLIQARREYARLSS
jgi:tetratricopeptide (TPR) repeat protein